jgi:hypothetical protein
MRQHAGRQGNRDHVVPGSPPQILHHFPVASPAQRDDLRRRGSSVAGARVVVTHDTDRHSSIELPVWFILQRSTRSRSDAAPF